MYLLLYIGFRLSDIHSYLAEEESEVREGEEEADFSCPRVSRPDRQLDLRTRKDAESGKEAEEDVNGEERESASLPTEEEEEECAYEERIRRVAPPEATYRKERIRLATWSTKANENETRSKRRSIWEEAVEEDEYGCRKSRNRSSRGNDEATRESQTKVKKSARERGEKAEKRAEETSENDARTAKR